MIKANKGISLVSLVITIAVMIIIASITVTGSLRRIEINNLNKLKNDLELLEDKVSNYYLKYNAIPVLRNNEDNTIIKYDETTLNFDKNAGDNDNYYIIDLEAMGGISLYYGEVGFKNPNTSDDVYIINEKSHQIYYVRGIELDGEWYHSILDNNSDISIANDKIPPTKPKMKMVSGEKNEQGVYTTAVSIEFVPGKDNGSGVERTTYSVNDEPEKLTSTLPNNTLTIEENGTYNIKARSYDMANNVSDKTEIDITIKDTSKMFITKWNVKDENGDTTVVLPIHKDYIYDAVIHWGDGARTPVQWQGKTETLKPEQLIAMVTHNYGEIEESENAEKIISIEGTYPYFVMSTSTSTPTESKLIQIEQWGNVNFTTINFNSCKNLISPIPEPSEDSFANVTSMSALFKNCTNLDGEIPENLFLNCHKLTNLEGAFGNTNISGTIPPKLFKDCENVQKLSGFFMGSKNITGNIPEELFSYCKNVTNLNYFFGTGITGEIPENLFKNCSNLTSMQGIFRSCSGLNGSIPENLFANCVKLTDVSQAFRFCTGITGEIPENLFAKCSEVTTMEGTFEGTKVTRIPLNLFGNCNKITNFQSTFYNCTMLTGDAPELWKRDNVTKSSYCFNGCKNLSNYNEIPSAWGGGGE